MRMAIVIVINTAHLAIVVILIAIIIILIIILIISSAADSLGAISEGRLLPHQHNAHYAEWTFYVQCVITYWLESGEPCHLLLPK